MLNYIDKVKIEYKLSKLMKLDINRIRVTDISYTVRESYVIYIKNRDDEVDNKICQIESEYSDIFFIILNNTHSEINGFRIYADKIQDFIKDIKMTKKLWSMVIMRVLFDNGIILSDKDILSVNKFLIQNVYKEYIDFLENKCNLKCLKCAKDDVLYKYKVYKIEKPKELYTLFKIIGFIN